MDMESDKDSLEGVSRVYELLLHSAEAVENSMFGESDPQVRSCMAILLDDIDSLIEESQFLILCEPCANTLFSLESRADTVLGEVKKLLRSSLPQYLPQAETSWRLSRSYYKN
jgi:hypothetical protein